MMSCCTSTERQQSRSPNPSQSNSLTYHVSDHNTRCAQEQWDEEIPNSQGKSPGVPLFADEDMVIISIRGTDLTLGLGRVPAGFYAVVCHSNLEWRTEDKPVSTNDNELDWHGLISIPSDPSTDVSVAIYASFEFQPTLGNGKELRRITVTIGELLDHSAKDLLFVFSPKEDDVPSPCSSLLVTVGRWKRDDISMSTPILKLRSFQSIMGSDDQLGNATDRGHSALSHYRKKGIKQDLQCAIEEFEHALGICPQGHPCLAAVQSNLAMAKFIDYRANDPSFSLGIPLALYRNALAARPAGHPDRASTLIQLAAVHSAWLQQQGDSDVAEIAALLHEAMELSSTESHEHQAAILMLQLHEGQASEAAWTHSQSKIVQDFTQPSQTVNMDPLDFASSLLDCFEQSCDLTDLQRAISVLKASVRSITLWSHRYPEGLNYLGIALVYRFECLGGLDDLKEAISRFQGAIGFISDDHPDKPAILNNLGNSLSTRFERLGSLDDLEEAILRHQDAVRLIPDGHPNKPACLTNLSSSFRTRFEHLGELGDLEEAISRDQAAIRLVPDGRPDKPGYLNNLAISFITRFRHFGELSDLQEAISKHRDAAWLTSDSHPGKPRYLSNLGTSVFIRFERLGELSDLDEAILRQQGAVHLTPNGHPDQPARLNDLGNSLLARFDRLGELGDLQEAISRHEDAVCLTPNGHPGKSKYLGNLGTSFSSRFERLGELSDLEKAISRKQDAVRLVLNSDPDKPGLLNSLGTTLRTRFKHIGELGDLDEAISMQRNAVHLTPDGHLHKLACLINLGVSLKTRFQHFGKLDDIEEAIVRQQDAVHLTPDGHPEKARCFNNLGTTFLARFVRIGELSDLENAISRYQDAVCLTPDGHPDKVGRLNNLSTSFFTRFQRLGELGDLEETISRQQDIICLTPNGHPDKPVRLHDLGTSLRTRFHRLGELSDLEEAISRSRDAVRLITDGHPDKPTCLTNLGTSLRTRFERLKELGDLEEAVLRQQDAIYLVPDGHPDKPAFLNNLGISFTTRFHHLGELSDLEEAISRIQDAAHITPDGHPEKAAYLNNLGTSFRTRFKCLREPSDLEEAILKHWDAIRLTPDGHPDRPGHLNNLGDSLILRFKHFGEPSDLDEAILRQQDAIRLAPSGHPDKPGHLYNLGNWFFTRFEHFEDRSDLLQALRLSSGVACSSVGDVTLRFRASQTWILSSRLLHHHSLLDAHSVAITLFPQLAWVGLSFSRRYRELVQGTDIVREAAAAALESGRPETAVEWLEHGRSVVWGDLLQLRSSYDELSSAHPDHARRLRELSAALDYAGATREKLSSLPSEQATSAAHRESLQQEADRHRMFAIERDKLLQNIRRLPGFERFLLHKEFSQLRASARFGPVVFLNATETRCDALIVLAELDRAIHVPLSNITLQRSKQLQTDLDKFVRQARGEYSESDERKGRPVPWDTPGCETILAPLWKCVVKPVLDALALPVLLDLPPRIFWCPTGPFTFLPIHAAGLYEPRFSQPGHKVFDFVVSSYTPALSILASPSYSDASSSGDIRLLAVRQPPSDGLRKLPGVTVELGHIREVIKNYPSARTSLMESSEGTVEEVLILMKDADWVHFACHGVQDARNPTDSGLCLANKRRLRVSDIFALSRPRGGLAFLSACQTATGDEDLSDEAVHIAAGMLFAGYGGVIGTMWVISDRLAPGLAKDVYERLFRNGSRPDYRDAARALHDAVTRLRRDKDVSFKDWLPFIHVGL